MNGAFPFGFEGATAMYLSLYAVTLLLHVLLLAYVLAGSGYVAVSALARGRSKDADPICAVLRDWLPFALGAAITAGVAPLLFLQILYKESFYTANLLLFHRWMAIVPVLVIGFYLLYLDKAKKLDSPLIPVAAFGCFLFTAYSWTEAHLLALDRESWAPFYAAGKLAYLDRAVPLRALVWIGGAFPLMATALGWQLRAAKEPVPGAARRLASIAFGGLVIAVAATIGYVHALPVAARDTLTSPMAMPYLVAGGLGLCLIAAGWAWQARRDVLETAPLVATSAGSVLVILAVIVAREALRVSSFDTEKLAALHRKAAGAGGMPLFILFLTVNAAAITWCFITVRRASRS